MQIWIHDKNMRKVCALNNNVPGMLTYSNSQWHTYLEYSTSTFDFVIPKIVNGKLHDDVKYINDQMYVSFYYDNSYHVFYVAKLVENDTSFQVTCNNTNLELATESARPLVSVDGPKSLEWYFQNLDLLGYAGLEIGINEVSDKTLTITFDSQQGTKLEQLHSLMNQFNAEFIFRTELNRDGTLKHFIIDIYQQADENHHGIGKVRGDVVLYYQSGLKGVQVSSDKTQLFNLGYFSGKDGLTLEGVEIEEKNELGQVEFYSKKGSLMICAPISADRYPSALGGTNEIDRWTRKDFETEYSDVDALKAYALRTIKQYAYPLMTYTVDVQSSFIENYKDINLGDTIKIIDNNFSDGLALEARVSEMIISFDMPLNNSVVFTNFRKLANKPSDALQQRINEIVAKATPYHVEISTTDGTVFKNYVGRSTVKPVLKQGDKTVDASFRFVIDGVIKYVGLTYDMVASDIKQPTALTISAWVDDKEVASEEITFLNVSDGNQGPKGADGKTSYVHTAWSYSADGTDRFTTFYPNLNLLDGSKDFSGNDWMNSYAWTNDGTYKGLTVKKRTGQWAGINKAFTAPKDGTYTFSAYIKSSGNTAYIIRFGGVNSSSSQDTIQKPMGNNFDWTRDVVTLNLKAGDQIWVKYEIYGDGKDSALWTAGHKWEEGSVATPWMPSESEVTTDDWPKYIGQYTNFTQVDSPNPSDYTWSLIRGNDGQQGPKGDQGIPGPKGADGKTQYTHIAYADTVSGSGFSLTDHTKPYIGMYQDFNPTNSQNPQDYRWSKWKGSDGEDGIPGKPGADGRTPYVHFAYADSADGRTGFSLTQTGNKRYLGVCTDFNQADSTNPADYTWNDTAGSVTVGGENLIMNSALPPNLDNWSLWYPSQPTAALSVATHSSYYNGTKPLFLLKATASSMVPAATSRFPVKRNTDYSLNIQLLASDNIWGVDIFVLGRKSNETDQINTKAFRIKDYNNSPSSSEFVKWHITFNSGELDEIFIRIDNKGTNNSSEALLYFTEVDCYEGTTDRVWQASPKDLKDEIDGKADNVLTQAQLNKLNEINSVLKAELDAKASLDTVNRWIKAYQDFVNANNADRAQAQKALADASARVVKLENNLNDMAERWNFIDSYMSTSNDGLVIGKKDNSSSIMFNPNGRISMFSAGNEVMYISQGVIHIENGIFSKTIQIGRFREEQDYINPDRNVIRYVGGI